MLYSTPLVTGILHSALLDNDSCLLMMPIHYKVGIHASSTVCSVFESKNKLDCFLGGLLAIILFV